jgi:murein L,D-transpeptidase YafK
LRRVLRVIPLITVILMALASGWYLWPREQLPPGIRADRIIIEKAARRLHLLHSGEVLKTYAVSLGSSPLGPKYCQGDGRTPEGTYKISGKNPGSKYHLALRVSYPGPVDKARAEKAACNPGGDIMIHGLPNGLGYFGKFQRWYDWTQGCIALTDPEIEEIYQAVAVGTTIVIKP